MGVGEGANRWWDKSLMWIVFKNGEAGFVGEHSCMDGELTFVLHYCYGIEWKRHSLRRVDY